MSDNYLSFYLELCFGSMKLLTPSMLLSQALYCAALGRHDGDCHMTVVLGNSLDTSSWHPNDRHRLMWVCLESRRSSRCLGRILHYGSRSHRIEVSSFDMLSPYCTWMFLVTGLFFFIMYCEMVLNIRGYKFFLAKQRSTGHMDQSLAKIGKLRHWELKEKISDTRRYWLPFPRKILRTNVTRLLRATQSSADEGLQHTAVSLSDGK